MAEAFLQVLIHNLSSLIEREVGLIMGVDKEMKKLSNTLTTIQKVLEDAEDKQFRSKAIQNWLSRLSCIGYEIEDILDECITEVSKLKHHGRKFNLRKILYNYKIGRRMKQVVEKLDVIAAERHNYQFHEVVLQGSGQVDWRRETGSIINEPDHVYGRDEDKKKIVDTLVKQARDGEQLSVLPIIGVGGLGKTTLAQLVYNDERVSQHFDTKLWVCVSDNFDLKILVKAMIESGNGSAPNFDCLDALQRRLCEVLNGKKYLLVLDDVWNDNQEDWMKLKSMLLGCGSRGCAVVVTTRQVKVAEIMRTLPNHYLKELTKEHCWLLFKLRAFGQENEQYHHPNLEVIVRQIVKKCAGVPLAAKALGGLLRFKREEKEWIRVKESEIWNLSEEETSILPVLRLSYRHLPFVLKRCFAYCAVFPKDFVIEKQDLIFRWMAHGCISADETQELEDVGDQIWKELVLRSFFQQVKISRTETTFKMHDLVHDLAQSIMEKNDSGAQTKANKIREVRWSEYSKPSSSSITQQVSTLTDIMNYKRLRILNLCEAWVEELPSSICKLKHLRYLNLSDSIIHSLPDTFCGLWNLQTLVLTNCYSLKSLPKNTRRMTNLRHIFLEYCISLSHVPSRIRELASLKTLSLFIVGNKIGNQLDELEHLNLGGKLEIKHLERVQNHINAKKANLVGKPNLRDLVLHWGDEGLCTMMEGEKVLEALKPHLNLETLIISGFKGRQFPVWMSKMENISRIFIDNCINCRHLPALGDLPHLQDLCIRNVATLEYIEGEDAKFQSLKLLYLISLPNLKGFQKEKLGDEIMFRNLQTLYIQDCELLTLPDWLGNVSSLTYLAIINCPKVSSLPSTMQGTTNLKSLNIEQCPQLHLRCEKEKGEDWPKIAHIPQLYI